MNRRAILEDVAAGRLAPRDAADLLATGRDAARCVRVRGEYQAIDVIADSSIADFVVVAGIPAVQRDGDVVSIDDTISDGRRVAASPRNRQLILRVNPDLELELHTVASSVSVSHVRGPVRIVARAGTTRLESLTGPLALNILSGSAMVSGTPRHGDWTLRVENGSLDALLDRDSSVTVSATSQHSHVDVLGTSSGWVLGSGERTLSIDAAFSGVVVRRDE